MKFLRMRILVLFAAGTMLVLTAIFYIQFILLRPIGSGLEDPNDRGYDAIRRVFLKAIVEHSVLRKELASR